MVRVELAKYTCMIRNRKMRQIATRGLEIYVVDVVVVSSLLADKSSLLCFESGRNNKYKKMFSRIKCK